MNNASSPGSAPSPKIQSTADTASMSETQTLDELRRLLFGGDLETLLKPPPVEAEAVKEVLAEAIAQSHKDEQAQAELVRATVPTVESAIRSSVATDLNVLSDALFPVIGPATRKSVSTAIRNLTESLNQGLEHSLSPQSFKWRLEARRTGRSFAEVVLLRTLIYQVEQVLLIHKETGLLLQQVVSDQAQTQDPDLVSAMLTAIQDFVQDSFHVESGGSLDTLEVGEMNIWIEAGPQAVLACVIRGSAPRELREQLQTTLEQIHRTSAVALRNFEGDQAEFENNRPYLADCLQSQYKRKGEDKATTNQRNLKPWLILGGISLLALGWLGLRFQANYRWQAYLSTLEQEPGLVVIQQERRGRQFSLTGLQDPLARSPALLLSETSSLPEKAIQMTWHPYLSLEPALLRQRWENRLAPPEGVVLHWDSQQVLHLSGVAPEQWVQHSQELLSSNDHLQGWNIDALQSAEKQLFDQLKNSIESRQILFSEGSAEVEASQKDNLKHQVEELETLVNLAQQLRLSPQILLLGNTDAVGDHITNQKLSQDRATALESHLLQ